jgi:DNA repair photolyase
MVIAKSPRMLQKQKTSPKGMETERRVKNWREIGVRFWVAITPIIPSHRAESRAMAKGARVLIITT